MYEKFTPRLLQNLCTPQFIRSSIAFDRSSVFFTCSESYWKFSDFRQPLPFSKAPWTEPPIGPFNNGREAVRVYFPHSRDTQTQTGCATPARRAPSRGVGLVYVWMAERFVVDWLLPDLKFQRKEQFSWSACQRRSHPSIWPHRCPERFRSCDHGSSKL